MSLIYRRLAEGCEWVFLRKEKILIINAKYCPKQALKPCKEEKTNPYRLRESAKVNSCQSSCLNTAAVPQRKGGGI